MSSAKHFLLALSLFGSQALAGDGHAELLLLRADGATLRIEVELALTRESRMRGLMGRTVLPRYSGMWFDFGSETRVSMWMRNTPLALDMVFIRGDGRVVGIHENAEPGSEALIRSPGQVRYVLEVEAGTARSMGIARGSRAWLIGR